MPAGSVAEPYIRITAPAPASTQTFFGDIWITFFSIDSFFRYLEN